MGEPALLRAAIPPQGAPRRRHPAGNDVRPRTSSQGPARSDESARPVRQADPSSAAGTPPETRLPGSKAQHIQINAISGCGSGARPPRALSASPLLPSAGPATGAAGLASGWRGALRGAGRRAGPSPGRRQGVPPPPHPSQSEAGGGRPPARERTPASQGREGRGPQSEDPPGTSPRACAFPPRIASSSVELQAFLRALACTLVLLVPGTEPMVTACYLGLLW